MKHEVDTLSGRLLDTAIAMLLQIDIVDQLTEYTPSIDWHTGGPILHSRGVGTQMVNRTQWRATVAAYVAHGPTPLIAGLRVLLLQHYGSIVDIPDVEDDNE